MNPGQKMSVFLLCSIFSVCNGLEEVSKMSPALDLTNIQVKDRLLELKLKLRLYDLTGYNQKKRMSDILS